MPAVLGVALLVLLLASCATRPATEVMVFVDAEPGVRMAAISVEILVEGSTGRGGAEFAQRELSSVAPRWPLRIALAPIDGDGQRVYRVTATALDGTSPTPALVAQVRAISGYRPGETVRIDLLLQDACLRHPACPIDETCVAGTCSPAMIDPATLLPLDTDASRVEAGAPLDAEIDARMPLDTGSDAILNDGGIDADATDAGDDGGSAVDAGLDGGPSVPTEEAILLAPDAAPDDQLGSVIALSADGTRALVGAFGDHTARVFLRTGTTWTHEATLLATDGMSGDQFGVSVALSSDGSRALVGANADDTAGLTDAGTARVFLRTGTSWAEEASLAASDGANFDYLGSSVALSATGDRALVGAAGDDTVAGGDAGSVRVFVRTGTTWAEEATLLASDGWMSDRLGGSVALAADGSRAIVGAPGDDTGGGTDAGGARVFLRTGSAWAQEATLLAADGAGGSPFGDYFGESVAISSSGDRALVGARLDDTASGTDAGSARVFIRTGTTWTEEATLLASDGAPSDDFGSSVALSSDGTRALVGAYLDDTFLDVDTGSVRVFVRVGTTWSEERTLLAPGGAAADFFGSAVALSSDGSLALVGAVGDDTTGGREAGSAHVFVLGP